MVTPQNAKVKKPLASILSAERRREWRQPPNFRCVVDADLLLRAHICVGREETRFYLTGVHIEPHADGGALLVATDGRRLIALRDPNARVYGGSAIVRLDKHFRRAARRVLHESAGAGKISKIVVYAGGAYLCGPSPKTLSERQVRNIFYRIGRCGPDIGDVAQRNALIDATFPDWRNALSGAPKSPASSGPVPWLNMNYMNDLQRALCDRNAIDPGLRQFCDGKDKPCLVISDSREIEGFGLIMPQNDFCRPKSAPIWSGLAAQDAPKPDAAAPSAHACVAWTSFLGLPIRLAPVTSSANSHGAQH